LYVTKNEQDKVLAELGPNDIVRKRDACRFFGLKSTAIDEAIARGAIPKPIALTPGGRAKGWLGSQILDHQRKLIEAAKAD
jgi:predicted DNA-binding transcriptional regulator AlpA